MEVTAIIEKIKTYTNEKLAHSYLQQYLDSPELDEDKVYFLTLPFPFHISEEQIKAISTTLLIEVALETHESIRNQNSEQFKEQQLTVLAGIYFSGLYYQILAKEENLNLVKYLASGIKEINEVKISLYKKGTDYHHIFQSLIKLETALIKRVFEFYNHHPFHPVLENVLFFKRLMKEQELFHKGEESVLFRALLKSSEDKGTDSKRLVMNMVMDKIMELRSVIVRQINLDPKFSNVLKDRILTIIHEPTLPLKTLAEEG